MSSTAVPPPQLHVNFAIRASKAKEVFGRAASQGRIFRYGVAIAMQAPVPDWWNELAAIAVKGERRVTSKQESPSNPNELEERIVNWLDDFRLHDRWSPLEAAHAVLLAAALPGLQKLISDHTITNLVKSLIDLHLQASSSGAVDDATTIMLGGELGLTLAWRLESAHQDQWLAAASKTIMKWCKHFESSQSEALSRRSDLRLIAGSLCRIESLAAHLNCELRAKPKKKTKKKSRHPVLSDCIHDLAIWVIGMTDRQGSLALTSTSNTKLSQSDLADDLAAGGLLQRLRGYDPESFGPAINAALGRVKSSGKLAWQVSLPEAMLHDEQSRIAILMPDWDVCRSRANIDYSQRNVYSQWVSGESYAIDGEIQTSISIDSVSCRPDGPWHLLCEYTDDDVHYLEIQQSWTNQVTLQRQFLVDRDERAGMFSDAIVPTNEIPLGLIGHEVRLPIGPSMRCVAEPETREVYLVDDQKRQVLVVPLSASEWRVGPTPTTLDVQDNQLVWNNRAKGRMYAPLWLDFLRRRFSRPRTWRKLTVAQDLAIVSDDDAIAFRMQSGSSHWVFYRSLFDDRMRTVLGKHLMADFIAARFDPGDGVFEELVTVDNETDS
jgi:hypothetical protein